MALANYTDFVKPYSNGYENGESGGTPVTAEILNTNYDGFLIALNTWAASVGSEMGNKVDKVTGKQLSDENYTSGEKSKLGGIASGATATAFSRIVSSGTKIGTLTINGTAYDIYAPNPGAGALADLTDVTLASPSNGQVLKYNASTSKWENANESGGGGGSYKPNGVTYVIDTNGTDQVQTGFDYAYAQKMTKYVDGVYDSSDSFSYAQAVTTPTNHYIVGNLKSTLTQESGVSYWVTTVIDGYVEYNGTVYETDEEVFRINMRYGSVIQNEGFEEVVEAPASVVEWEQLQLSGTKIATITIDGVDTDVYAPTSGGASALSGLSDVTLNSPSNGQILEYDGTTSKWKNTNAPTVPTKTSDLTNDSNFVADASYVHTDNNYTTTEKNKLADLVQVEANPSSGTSAGDLSTISINGTKYDIPSSGGGGTTVVANPSGTATDELEKLQVGSTIYSIPEGGESGEGWIDVKGTLTAGQTSITLTSSKIKTTSVIDYYTSIFGVSPTAVTVLDGSATLTFEAQATDMGVMISVRKLSEEKIFDLPLSALESNKIWFAYDGVRGFTHVLDTLGDGLRIYGGESANDWTTSGSVCIDLTEFSSVIPSSLTAMKFHFSVFTLTDYAAVRFFISNTKYEGDQLGSDAMLRSNGFDQMESSDSLDSSGFYTAQVDSQTLSSGRYLYIMVMTGSVGGTQGYGNGYNGTFDIQVDGIDFVTGGNS